MTDSPGADVTPTASAWAPLPYDDWSATCDTLHAHTQLLGKLAARLAPPEPQLQHCALRLTARGWETALLPAPDHSGALVVALDLRTHEAVIEHSAGHSRRIPLGPHRSVGEVTRDVLAEAEGLVGRLGLKLHPQEVPWSVPLDEDEEHHTYEPSDVARYFAAATGAAMVLAALRAPYRGRCTPVNAWWGSFDLAVSLFSGRPADPPSNGFIMRNSATAQQVEVGWWPGDARHRRAAFFAFASPAPDGFADTTLSPSQGRWDADLGEFLLEWDDVIASSDPYATALEFGRSAVTKACAACDWEPELAATVQGIPPPVS